MFRLLCAAFVMLAVPASTVFAETCHERATKAVDVRFADALGQRVFRDPNTKALPIPATVNDAVTLVVSGGRSYLHHGPFVGVIDGFKGVGQFGARATAHGYYHEVFDQCADPHDEWHALHMMHASN